MFVFQNSKYILKNSMCFQMSVCLISQESESKDHNFHTRVASDVNSFMAMKELIGYVIAVLRWMM